MFSFDRAPNWLVHVRRDVAEHLSFTMRVRDLSRQSQTWGTVPVVRSRELKQLVQLVEIPMQERFRQTLRIFALPQKLTCCTSARVRFYSIPSSNLLHEMIVQLQLAPFSIGGFEDGSPGSPDFPVQPEGATIDLLSTIPELAGNASVRIEVDTPGLLRRLWAFVAVTNNETQHVTLVSPQ